MNDGTSSQRSMRPRRVSWRTVILALFAIGTFFAIHRPGDRYVTPMGIGTQIQEDRGGVGALPPQDNSYPYPYPKPEVPITDAREFMKVNYNASLRTRDVPGLTRRVETTVRGNGGRIDQQSSDSRYGMVSFAIPQNAYDAFRTDLENLVGSRFLSVTISSQNLLTQKLGIEEQQSQVETALEDYSAARQKIVSAHTGTVQSLTARISSNEKQIVALRREPSTPALQAQIQAVTDEWSLLKRQLENENSSFAARLSVADANIQFAKDWQKAVQKQDTAFLDTIATVTGTVSVAWISLWDIARLYLPGYWIPVIFGLLTLVSFLGDRRRWSRFAQE